MERTAPCLPSVAVRRFAMTKQTAQDANGVLLDMTQKPRIRGDESDGDMQHHIGIGANYEPSRLRSWG